MGNWYRSPRTTQERRANQDWPVRGRRKPHRLPEAYDDVARSAWRDRSWKRYRRTQYKTKDIGPTGVHGGTPVS